MLMLFKVRSLDEPKIWSPDEPKLKIFITFFAVKENAKNSALRRRFISL